MLFRFVVLSLFVVFFTSPVLAADSAGNYAIWGVGRASCHQFLKASKDPQEKRYKTYLMGYMTAFNTLREETYNATGGQTLDVSLAWIAQYCAKHQMDSYDRAIQQLLADAYETRQRVPPGRERGWGGNGGNGAPPAGKIPRTP